MRRTGPAGGDSGRGTHAASEIASRCLPNAKAPEVHHGWIACIEPTEDRLLVRRIDESSMLTDAPKSIKGLVLACGPGKWHSGEWWGNEWIPPWRQPMTVQVGQIVAFNSRWNDLAHAENVGTGADGKGPLERPLSYKLDNSIHLIREADIFGILPNERVKVEYLGTAVEKEHFVNRRVGEP